MISGYVATQFSSKIFDSAGVYAPRRFHCQLQTNGISCKNLSTIQRSDQELQTSWAGTLVLSMVWVDKTMMVSSSNFSATPRKTASGNSCKILSTIQWSDQELWTIWAGTLVWPDETAQASHGDFIAMPRKRASWNPCKTLSTIQRSDQELWTIWAGTLVWPDKTPQASLGNLIATPRKQASWNSCKNLSTMQRSDQELRTCWAGTLVWPEETPPASNGDFIVTPRKLPKMCRLQRINNSLPSGEFCSELSIRCQSGVVCIKSLPKLSWLQRNYDSLPKLSCLLRVSICCRNCGASSETVFTAELLPAAKQFSLPNWEPAAKQFSLLNWAACSEPVLAADFYNKPPRQKWLKC